MAPIFVLCAPLPLLMALSWPFWAHLHHFDPMLDPSGSFGGSFWDHSGPFEVDVWLLFFLNHVEVCGFEKPKRMF